MTNTHTNNNALLRQLIRLIAYSALLYNFLVTALLVLRIVVGERSGLIAFANYGVMWLLLLTVPAALVCLLVLRWQGLAAIIPAMLALTFYAPQLMPKTQQEDGLRVATFNISGWLDDMPEKMRAFNALAENVDILAIEESADPDAMLQQTDGIFPYAYAQINTDISEHFGLFSRYPIDLDSIRFIDYSVEDWIRPASMRAVVDVDGQPISVYVMHTTRPNISPINFNSQPRDKGILWTLDSIREETNPVILLCDCNMSEWTAPYQWVHSVLTDSWRERGVGFGLTDPATRHRAPFALLRNDYIWHSSDFEALSIQVMPDNGGSEHFPVRAVLRLKNDD